MINWISDAIVNWLNHAKPLPATPLSDFQRILAEVSPGDVVLVEGRTRVSEVIKLITQSSWSHAALYIGTLGDLEDSGLRETLLQHIDHPLQPGEAEQIKPFVDAESSPAGAACGGQPDPSPQEASATGGAVSERPEEQWIIESELGLGTVVRPLSVYDGEHLRICRPRGLRELDQQRILAAAAFSRSGKTGRAADRPHGRRFRRL